MCLYGNDLDETTTPIEAGLTWVIGMLLRCRVICLSQFLGIFFLGKDRREKGGFIGAPSVQQQLKDGPTRRRVGLLVEGAPARRRLFTHIFSSSSLKRTMAEGAKILSPSGDETLGELILNFHRI